MKAILRLQQFADTSTASEELKKKMSFIKGKTREGKPIPIAVYPAGTVFEGDIALQLVSTGQAIPSDDECCTACGKSAEELTKLQLEYEMNVKGINKPEDREMYRAGVILGYDKNGKYLPGPMWSAYQAALADDPDETKDEE